jgi:hypothetical protein
VPTRSTTSASRITSLAMRPRPISPPVYATHHARGERVRLVDRALAERRGRDRRVEQLRHAPQLVPRA